MSPAMVSQPATQCVSFGPRGLTAVELLVIVAIVGLCLLLLISLLPQLRDAQRDTQCQANLQLIGQALESYTTTWDRFPPVADLDLEADQQLGPWSLLIADLEPERLAIEEPEGLTLESIGWASTGLLCPSDPEFVDAFGTRTAPTSYRFLTGDQPEGRNGPFAPGMTRSPSEIEDGDGLAFTLGVIERLHGNGQDGSPYIGNYQRVEGNVGPSGCPELPPETWRGDAGSSWVLPSYRSSLANTVVTPNASRSCISLDGRTAAISASSGHVQRIYTLALDFSVRSIASTIDPGIWNAWATIARPVNGPSVKDRPADLAPEIETDDPNSDEFEAEAPNQSAASTDPASPTSVGAPELEAART